MPIFLDRHDVVTFSAEEVAKLHVKDLEIQDQYGVKFLTYWSTPNARRHSVSLMPRTRRQPTGSMPKLTGMWPMK